MNLVSHVISREAVLGRFGRFGRQYPFVDVYEKERERERESIIFSIHYTI